MTFWLAEIEKGGYDLDNFTLNEMTKFRDMLTQVLDARLR